MAKEPKPKESKEEAAKKQTLGRKFMLWVVLPITSLIFLSTAVVCAAGMIPTAVAYLIDKSEGKYAMRTVGYMNLSGCIFVSMEMWASGDHTLERAFYLLGDPLNWLIMFGTAGLGWVIYFMLPPVVFSYLHAYSLIRNKRIKERQTELIKEWGDVVKESAPMVSADLMRFDPDLAQEDGTPPPLSEEDAAKVAATKRTLEKKAKEAAAKEIAKQRLEEGE